MDEPTRVLAAARYPGGAESARVAGEISAALTATGRPMLRHLDVSASEGQVVLRGRVSSYFLKQLAQSAALAHPSVDEVRNELEVVAPV